MALTKLDPKTALVLIGLQHGIVAPPAVPRSGAEVVARGIEVHENAIERIFPQIGQRATTAEILDVLAKTRG